MIQIQFQMKEEAMEGLKAEAAKMGITPNILARIIMNKHFSPPGSGEKSYTFTAENWREIEAYVKVKGLGNVEVLVTKALEDVMSRNRLTPAQKAKYERLLGN